MAVNWIYLSGVLADEPIEDKGRDGAPLTLLTVAFPAPDASETQERMEVASCEVEVPPRCRGRTPGGCGWAIRSSSPVS
jgi:hypothetical protein